MKTQTNFKKTASVALFVLLVYGHNTIAQSHMLVEADRDKQNDSSTLILSIILFIVGFAVLIALKMREDKKPHRETPMQYPTHTTRNKYGHRHQYNH